MTIADNAKISSDFEKKTKNVRIIAAIHFFKKFTKKYIFPSPHALIACKFMESIGQNIYAIQ